MFPLFLVAFLALLGLGIGPIWFGDGHIKPLFALLSLLPGAGIAAVVLQWLSNPDGIKDFTQGGVVGMKQNPYFLKWYDWAIFITRRGTIDKNSGLLRLQRKLFFGLIPMSSVVRPIAEFYRVEVDAERVIRTRSRRRDAGIFDSMTRDNTYVARIDYTVRLVDRGADGVVVLDVSDGASSGRGGQFCGRLREAIEDIMGRPGERPQRRKIEPRDPHEDDYDAWLRKKQERGEA